MEQIYILQCENSQAGIFTGIYEAYARKLPPEQTVLTVGEEFNYRLFAKYDTIPVNDEAADKVARTLRSRLGEAVYGDICIALSAQDEQKAEAVYRTVVKGLGAKRPERILENLTDPYVHHVFELARSGWNEVHRWKQFLRFKELEHHMLLAIIGPQYDVLTFVAPHFADRLPMENFAIYDDKRDCMVLHPAQKDWYLLHSVGNPVLPDWSGTESKYQELFCYFCHKIGIKERNNPKLQQQMVSYYFQNYMLEFDEKNKKNRKEL